MKSEIQELEIEINKPNFWDNIEYSTKITSKMKRLKKDIEEFEDLQDSLNNVEELNTLVLLEQDSNLENEILKNTKEIEEKIEKLEIKTLLSGKYDKNNAILTLHPGAGGTESQDWVQMLYRMYTKWSNSNGYEIKELDFLEGDEAGIKSVTFSIIR